MSAVFTHGHIVVRVTYQDGSITMTTPDSAGDTSFNVSCMPIELWNKIARWVREQSYDRSEMLRCL